MSTAHSPVLHSEDADRAHDALGHLRAHKASVKPKPGITLNVTSMVDILFNLLVYFIVTANFAMDEGSLKASLPIQEPPGTLISVPDPDGSKHLIDVRGNRDGTACQLFLDGKSIPDFAALRAVLDARKRPQTLQGGGFAGMIDPKIDTLIIRPSSGVRWQHVVDAFNQVAGAGYARVRFDQDRAVAAR